MADPTAEALSSAPKRLPCDVCGPLDDEEYAKSKWGSEENDTRLPAAAGSLVLVRDLSPGGSRELKLERCPKCGTYYLYRTDYEYLANGSEDEEFLTRLSDDAARQYLEPPDSRALSR